jgi:hypothetical protein
MIKDTTAYSKIKDDNAFHTWVTGSKATKAYILEKKTSLRTTPKKPKSLRGRP